MSNLLTFLTLIAASVLSSLNFCAGHNFFTTTNTLLFPTLPKKSSSNINSGTPIVVIHGGATALNSLLSQTVIHDIEVSTFVTGASIGWLQLWIYLAKEGVIQPNLSRKIIHRYYL